MTGWEFDLELLYTTVGGWVPVDVRYGVTKISDFARKTPEFPAVPGVLWELVAS